MRVDVDLTVVNVVTLSSMVTWIAVALVYLHDDHPLIRHGTRVAEEVADSGNHWAFHDHHSRERILVAFDAVTVEDRGTDHGVVHTDCAAVK